MLTPQGRKLDQSLVQELSQHKRLLLLCGRYEGFDDRIVQGLKPLEVSVGDFICNGGEVPAMLIIDSVIRLIPASSAMRPAAATTRLPSPACSSIPSTRSRASSGG